jgi:hypothetical protein
MAIANNFTASLIGPQGSAKAAPGALAPGQPEVSDRVHNRQFQMPQNA